MIGLQYLVTQPNLVWVCYQSFLIFCSSYSIMYSTGMFHACYLHSACLSLLHVYCTIAIVCFLRKNQIRIGKSNLCLVQLVLVILRISINVHFNKSPYYLLFSVRRVQKYMISQVARSFSIKIIHFFINIIVVFLLCFCNILCVNLT